MARPRAFDEQQVVQQAMQLFWQKGYRQTSPRDLLEATGLSKSSLYATFGSKRELFLRVLAIYGEEQGQVMAAMLGQGNLRQGLELMYAQLLEMVTSAEGPNACLVCMTSLEVDDDPAIDAQLAQARGHLVRVFRSRLERARSEGELGPDADPEALASFLFTTNMGLVAHARAGGSPEELGRAVQLALKAVFG